jgi:hypothetical protein
MDRTLDFDNFNWGRILNSDNATQIHSIFVKPGFTLGGPFSLPQLESKKEKIC